MRRTKIVCTLGPSTDDALVMQDMIKVGMNVARLNMSHGSFNEHSARMELVRKTQRELNLVVGIMLDTKGPEIRLRTFKEGKVLLSDGQMFVLTTEQSVEGTENIVAVNYLDLPKKVKVGDTILINDGKIDLAVKSIEGREVHCVVRFGGEVSDK
ncbi:MAG: pyruvate kinase, partial [Clostridiales bacterium]|nr:pyruvate kinase [Clostridiales bacterium]